MTTLSGGISTSAPVAAVKDTGYSSSPWADLMAGLVSSTYMAPTYSQPSYSVPTLPVYTAPTTIDNSSTTPINVNYSPIQQSSATMNVPGVNFPTLVGLSPTDTPQPVQIGGRLYNSNQVIADAPTQSFAPGQQPQFDTVNDGAYGYQGTMIPANPNTPPASYQLGGGYTDMPENLPAPNLNDVGMPNPYGTRPIAPTVVNGPIQQAAYSVPSYWVNQLPNRDDYFQHYGVNNPGPALTANPMSWIKRGIASMPSVAHAKAANARAVAEWHKEDANRITQMAQTMGPSMLGFNKEQMAQQQANFRLEVQAWNQGALAALQFMLDQEDKKTIDAAKALSSLSQAFLLPPTVIGDTGALDQMGRPIIGQIPNREKIALIRLAAGTLGLTEADIYGLSKVQDVNAAEQQKQAALATREKALEVSKLQQLLPYEISLLKARIAEVRAQANVLNSQARTANFNVKQREAIAKYERWGMIADSMDRVSKMLVGKATRNANIQEATLRNKKLMADTLKARMEANAIPEESAAKMSSALAALAFNNTDANSQKVGAALLKSIEEALNGNQQQMQPMPVPTNQPQTNKPWRNAQAPQIDPSYFSGRPLTNAPVTAVAGE